jgi:hypothetical protein
LKRIREDYSLTNSVRQTNFEFAFEREIQMLGVQEHTSFVKGGTVEKTVGVVK